MTASAPAPALLNDDEARAASLDGGLVLRDVRAGYGGAQALFGVSLVVRGGSSLALLGVNGAGKSTLGRVVSGLVPATSGSVFYDGADITGQSPHRISRAGLRYVPEGRGIFPGLSVAENLRHAVLALPRSERAPAVSNAYRAFPALGGRPDQRAGSLSGGEQQLLAMSMALAVKPRLMIADEMSLGLAPKMVNAVFEGLEQARAAGITVVLVEQFIHRALAYADDCAILTRGELSWHGPAGSAGNAVLDQYLGENAAG